MLVAVALAAGCGGGGGPGRPAPTGGVTVGRPLETYQQLGLIAGPAHFPAVASFATLAGPADSTYVVFGLSLPASALRFQRDESGFLGEYRIAVTFLRDSQQIERFERTEPVRVSSFAETSRTDESVVFQQVIAVAPGRYEIHVAAGDVNSSRAFRTEDTLTVPSYGSAAARVSSPIVVYRADGRTTRAAPPDLIVNPRHTVAYGGDAPRVYIESYGADEPVPVRLRVEDDGGNEVWSTEVSIGDGDPGVRHAIVDLPGGTLPLGKLWVSLEAIEGPAFAARAPLVISISDQWMVANFEDVLQFLRYIATPAELDSLQAGSPAERRQRWDAFWAKRDPLPASPVNEFREQFFDRVRFATEQFSEPGSRQGWETDRGEVFIVLGPPDYAQDRYAGRTDVAGQPNAIEWQYDNAAGSRLTLIFVDRTGFGRYELTPSAEASFRSVAERLKPRSDRDR